MKLWKRKTKDLSVQVASHEDGTYSLALTAHHLQPRAKSSLRHFDLLSVEIPLGLTLGHPDGLLLRPQLVVKFFARPSQTQLRALGTGAIRRLSGKRSCKT